MPDLPPPAARVRLRGHKQVDRCLAGRERSLHPARLACVGTGTLDNRDQATVSRDAAKPTSSTQTAPAALTGPRLRRHANCRRLPPFRYAIKRPAHPLAWRRTRGCAHQYGGLRRQDGLGQGTAGTPIHGAVCDGRGQSTTSILQSPELDRVDSITPRLHAAKHGALAVHRGRHRLFPGESVTPAAP